MIFCAGDLIRIPSDVTLIKTSETNPISDYKITNKPELVLFIKYTKQGLCLVSKNGEKWTVEPSNLRIYENKNDQTYTNNKIQ